MDLQLKDRCALVTGAGDGLGRAIALGLAAEGCRLVLVGRRGALLEGVAEAALALGAPAAIASPLDLGDAEAHAAAWPAWGEIDVVVHGAWAHLPGHEAFEAVPQAAFEEVLARNLAMAGRAIRPHLPGMRARGFGRLIFLGSLAGLLGGAKQSAYAAGKTALDGLARSLALEAGRDGVTAHVVHPGLIATERTEAVVKGKAARWIALKAANGRLGQPEEVADLVCFLASPRAGHLTGGSWPIAGGLELGFSL